MGIHNLAKLLADFAPDCIKETKIESYFGRKIAIDASMSIYQFLIAVKGAGVDLTNEAGEVTSHLQGIFSRTIRMLDVGIKPVYVFDGKPPVLKSQELSKRRERMEEAKAEATKAEESGDAEAALKFGKRSIRVSKEQNEECKRLLRLMGIPIVEAPGEAEAQCAALARAGKVYGTGTEDMDALTFGTPILVRHLTFSEARKEPILEINLEKALAGLELTMEEFIDLCILCGCDYCGNIRGIGYNTATKLIKKHKSIEGVVGSLDQEKTPLPESFPFAEARELFRNPEIVDPETIELKWTEPDEEGLKKFLVEEKQFNLVRVENAIAKMKATRSKSTQGRLDSFFSAGASSSSTLAVKRKAEEMKAKESGAKGKGKADAKGKGPAKGSAAAKKAKAAAASSSSS